MQPPFPLVMMSAMQCSHYAPGPIRWKMGLASANHVATELGTLIQMNKQIARFTPEMVLEMTSPRPLRMLPASLTAAPLMLETWPAPCVLWNSCSKASACLAGRHHSPCAHIPSEHSRCSVQLPALCNKASTPSVAVALTTLSQWTEAGLVSCRQGLKRLLNIRQSALTANPPWLRLSKHEIMRTIICCTCSGQ